MDANINRQKPTPTPIKKSGSALRGASGIGRGEGGGVQASVADVGAHLPHGRAAEGAGVGVPVLAWGGGAGPCAVL